MKVFRQIWEEKVILCVYILNELHDFYAYTAGEKHKKYQNKIEF